MKRYYIAKPEGPVGPYRLDQLMDRGVAPDELVWCDGMTDWLPAGDIPELTSAIRGAVKPPKFDRSRFETNYTGSENRTTGNTGFSGGWQPGGWQQGGGNNFGHGHYEQQPPNYMVLAIIGIIMFFPLGIPALIKSCAVNPSWEKGDVEGAREQSRGAKNFAIWAIIVGIIVNGWYMSAIGSLIQ